MGFGLDLFYVFYIEWGQENRMGWVGDGRKELDRLIRGCGEDFS